MWTAIFEDQEVKIFSTHFNSYEEAQSKASLLWGGGLFALIKGSHPDVKFF